MSLTGEVVFAAIGLNDFVTPGPIRLTIGQARSADKMPKRIEAESMALVSLKKPEKAEKRKDFDWEAVVEGLRAPATGAEVAARIESIEPPAIVGPVSQTAAVALEYLRSLIPVRVTTTLLGPRRSEPSYVEISRLREAYEVIEDPFVCINSCAAWQLGMLQVKCLATVYPEVHALIRRSLLVSVGEFKGESIPWSLEKQIRTLAMVPLDGDLMTRVAAVAEAEKAEPSQGGGGSVDLAANKSSTERIDG